LTPFKIDVTVGDMKGGVIVAALCAALRAAALGVAVLGGAAILGAPAQAEMAATPAAPNSPAVSTSPAAPTSATIAPVLSSQRPRAHAALTVAIHYAGGEAGVPAPVRRSVVRFPAGLTLDIPHLRSCSPARLLARGPAGCPAQSALGRGEALTVAREGAVLVREHVVLWAFLGEPHDGFATVEILGEGYTPLQRRTVVTGSMSAASAPYGEELTIPFPPIPTVPGGGDASLVSFSLTIGPHALHHSGTGANSVVVPASCPSGGLPFAAEFSYADGSTGSAAATVPCVAAASRVAKVRVARGVAKMHVARRVAKVRVARGVANVRVARGVASAAISVAHAARTVSLNETGHLHLVGKPHGFTLYEQGTATGTAAGSIYVRLTAVSSSRVTAEVNIYPKGGYISGYASASYRTSGNKGLFAGSMSVTRGSGSYAHAHGSGLRFSGSIERSNDAITVQVSGSMSD
jgi:hypothetical protein